MTGGPYRGIVGKPPSPRRLAESAAGETLDLLGETLVGFGESLDGLQRAPLEGDEQFRARILEALEGHGHDSPEEFVQGLKQAIARDAALEVDAWKRTAGRWRTIADRRKAELEKALRERATYAADMTRSTANLIQQIKQKDADVEHYRARVSASVVNIRFDQADEIRRREVLPARARLRVIATRLGIDPSHPRYGDDEWMLDKVDHILIALIQSNAGEPGVGDDYQELGHLVRTVVAVEATTPDSDDCPDSE